ncbi:hypothetical protein C8Q77DRAFT_1063410 [Trametes polyzona]|nr:hypothetical protein C8Q77DRAFT_1063410 [Trametes polyzona]
MRGLHSIFTSAFAGQGLVAAASAPVGGVVPTAPGPNDVFKQGGDCKFSWTPDTSGTWKQTDVELMTGDNFHMVFLTTVASFDGTDPSKTSFTFPCPEVTPNSAIYFYQFNSPAAGAAPAWTTRFTIADAQGNASPPPNDTQPDGQKIAWGTGALRDPSKAVPAPSYLAVGAAPPASSASGSTTASATSSGSSSSAASSGSSTASEASSSSSSSAAQSTTTAESSSSVEQQHVTRTSTVGPAPTSGGDSGSGNGNSNNNNGTNGGNGTGPNGALALRAEFGMGSTVFALGLAAIAFAVAL